MLRGTSHVLAEFTPQSHILPVHGNRHTVAKAALTFQWNIRLIWQSTVSSLDHVALCHGRVLEPNVCLNCRTVF